MARKHLSSSFEKKQKPKASWNLSSGCARPVLLFFSRFVFSTESLWKRAPLSTQSLFLSLPPHRPMIIVIHNFRLNPLSDSNYSHRQSGPSPFVPAPINTTQPLLTTATRPSGAACARRLFQSL